MPLDPVPATNGDEAGGWVDDADGVAFGVGDVDAATGVGGEAFGAGEGGGGGRAAVA